MQYDENAEKYGYEGEMTPIECDKLKPYTYDDMIDGDADTNIEYYPKSDADAIIAQKDFEIDRLKELNAFLKQRISNGDVGCSIFLDDLEQKDKEIAELKADVNNVLIQNRELCQARQVMYSAEEYTKRQDENTQLKQKLENVQASMYCDVVDANMEIRRLRRALYKACANWAHFAVAFFSPYAIKNKWYKMERKCRAKAEEYK